MKKVDVHYEGWGEHWHLGTLADNGQKILFEYSNEALRQGLELSPRHLPLSTQASGPFPEHLMRLPGLVSDSLPDGWGMLLMNRTFRKQGLDEHSLSPLTRLSFIGHRAMGALSFTPEITTELEPEWIALRHLASESQLVLAGEDTPALQQLALLGGSPHGARPKVMVHRNAAANRMSTQPSAGTVPWLVKFQAQDEPKEVCAIEDVYAELARRCGLDMPNTTYFDLSPSLAAFGIERFDVEQGLRVPTHTLAGLMHANFRVPQIDYVTFLRATRWVTKDIRETWKAYERAVFNVLFHNRDDHTKNFSYRLDRGRNWKLAPCYDLTFNEGPGGEHFMDIGGEARNITRGHLLSLAKSSDLDIPEAGQVIDRMREVAEAMPALLRNAPVTARTTKDILAKVRACQSRLA